MNNAILLNIVSSKQPLNTSNSFNQDVEQDIDFDKLLEEKNNKQKIFDEETLINANVTKSSNSNKYSNKSNISISKSSNAQQETPLKSKESIKALSEILSLIIGLLKNNDASELEKNEENEILITVSPDGLAQFNLDVSKFINAIDEGADSVSLLNMLDEIKVSFSALNLTNEQINSLVKHIDVNGLLELNSQLNLANRDKTLSLDFGSNDIALLKDSLALNGLNTNKESTSSRSVLSTQSPTVLENSYVLTNNARKDNLILIKNIADIVDRLMNNAIKPNVDSTDNINFGLKKISHIDSNLLNLDETQNFNIDGLTVSDDIEFIQHINEQILLAKLNTTQAIKSLEYQQLTNNELSITIADSQETNMFSFSPVEGNKTQQANLTTQFGTDTWQAALKQQILFFIKNGIQNAELRLHPQELGVIHIQIAMDDNLVKLQLFSGNAQVRNSMENSINMLKESFSEQGFELGESFVGFSDFNESSSDKNEQLNKLSHALLNDTQVEESNSENLQQNDDLHQTKRTSAAGVDNFI